MTRLDALAVQECDARRAVIRRLGDLDRATHSMRLSVANHALPSTVWLCAKTAAVSEAVDIWEATAHALTTAEEKYLDTPMNELPGNDPALSVGASRPETEESN